MTPFYESGGMTIYHADVREIVAVDIGMFDVVIADPPYGETALEWDDRLRGWPAAMTQICKVSGSMWVFGSFRYFFDERNEFELWNLAQDIVWEKHNGSSFQADRFKRVHEHVVQFYRGAWEGVYKKPVTTPDATARTVRRRQQPPHTGDIGASSYASNDGGPRLMRSVIPVRSCHGMAVHPTQKPVGIIDPLLRYSCPEGGRVLDPFMGSGSGLVAAKALGLHAVGFEVNENDCEMAAKRLAQEVLQFS